MERFKHFGSKTKKAGLVFAPIVVASLALSGCAGKDGTIEPVNYTPNHIELTGRIQASDVDIVELLPDGTTQPVFETLISCRSEKKVDGISLDEFESKPINNGYELLS